MADTLTQTGRPVTVTHALSDADTLVAVRVVGREALSEPFSFTVDFVSLDAAIDASQVLGKPMGLSIMAPDDQTRLVHGLVRRWTDLGKEGALYRRYQAEVVPWLAMLELSGSCRTFENKTPLDIVEAVFKAAGFSDYRRQVTTVPDAIPYEVQYGESDFAFVSRVLEAAGLFYRVEFAADKHTIVLSDAVGSVVPAGDVATIDYTGWNAVLGSSGGPAGNGSSNGTSGAGGPLGRRPGQAAGAVVGAILPGGASDGRARDGVDALLGMFQRNALGNVATELLRDKQVHTKTFSASDFNLLRAADTGSTPSQDPGSAGERYGFLGTEDGTDTQGQAVNVTKRLMKVAESGRDVIRGATLAPQLVAGTRVKFTGGALGTAGVEVQVTEVGHVVELGSPVGQDAFQLKYVNEFVAVPAATPVAPNATTPRPSVRGTQTALVVGAQGAEIDVDKDGRVLLQFPWDQGDGKDGKSQHRVHVASLWAGAGWGAIHLPRVGQQVLVDFLEGNPARPIVTGRVYSNNHPHPYALPDNKTQSGIKSRSSMQGGADNFNELRFEDLKGSEHVYLQAEKDLQVKVKNDETRDVLHDRTTTITNNDTRTVSEGNDAHTVSKGNQTVEVTQGDQTTTVKQGNQTVEVSTGDQTVTVGTGKQTISVNGDQSLTVKTGNRSTTIQTGNDELKVQTGNLNVEVSLGSITVKAPLGAITIESPVQGITLKCGPSSIALTPAGVEIKGVQVSVEGTAMAALKGPMVQVSGNAMTQVSGSALLQLSGGVMMMG